MRENCTYSLSGGRWPACKRATSDPTGDQATPGEHFDGEEINACQDGHMRPNEVCPVHVLPALRSRGDTEPAQNVTDGLIGDVVAEVL
jgi:hypothetical protein